MYEAGVSGFGSAALAQAGFKWVDSLPLCMKLVFQALVLLLWRRLASSGWTACPLCMSVAANRTAIAGGSLPRTAGSACLASASPATATARRLHHEVRSGRGSLEMYRIRLSLTCSLWLCSSELHTVYNASFPLCGVLHQIGRNSSSSGIATVCSIVCDMCKAGA